MRGARSLLRTAALAAAAVLLAGSLLSCGSANKETSAPVCTDKSVESDLHIALISDGGSGEGYGVSGPLREFAGKNGFSLSEFSSDADVADSVTEAIDSAVEIGADVVVCEGTYPGKAAIGAQASYPSVQFLVIADESFCGAVKDELLENTHCVGFRFSDLGYVAGYIAVCEGYKNVAFASVIDGSTSVNCLGGFVQGASDACREYGTEDFRVLVYSDDRLFSENGESAGSVPAMAFFEDGADAAAAMGIYTEPVCGAAAELGKKVIPVSSARKEMSEVLAPYPVFDGGTAAVSAIERLISNGGKWSVRDAGTFSRAGLAEGCVKVVFPETGDGGGFDPSAFETVKERFSTGAVRLRDFDSADEIVSEYSDIVVDRSADGKE